MKRFHRVDTRHAGFEWGLFAGSWRRLGRLMVLREVDPYGTGWFVLWFSKEALSEFYEGVCK